MKKKCKPYRRKKYGILMGIVSLGFYIIIAVIDLVKMSYIYVLWNIFFVPFKYVLVICADSFH